MITIEGASDDLVEVVGCEGADEFPVDGKGVWRGDLVARGGTEQMRIYAEWDAARNGCWLIVAVPTDEDVPMPDWPVSVKHEGYNMTVGIDAPAGTRLTNLYPERED